MTASKDAIDFIGRLKVPEGPRAGKPIKLAKFQKTFIRGALRKKTAVAVLSVGRGNGKSTLTAGIALSDLIGVSDDQPRREIIIAARTRDQAHIVYQYAAGLASSLPEEIQEQITYRRSPRLEIEYDGDGGGHIIRCIAADAKNALGSSPTLCVMDERGHWDAEKGDSLESALLSGLGKRGGRALIISTSAPDDQHSLSQWLDHPPEGTYTQEHRPAPGCPPTTRIRSWPPIPVLTPASGAARSGSRLKRNAPSPAAAREAVRDVGESKRFAKWWVWLVLQVCPERRGQTVIASYTDSLGYRARPDPQNQPNPHLQQSACVSPPMGRREPVQSVQSVQMDALGGKPRMWTHER